MSERSAVANGSTPIRPEAVRCQLSKILASGQFLGAPRSSRFLQVTVERVLQDRGSTLKEYSIGVEILGRPESFDPRLDAIVRVEASRLRSKLKTYYAGDGGADPVLIELPKGSYIPVFRENRTKPLESQPAAPLVRSRSRASRSALIIGLVAVGTLTAIAMAWWTRAWWVNQSRSVPARPVLTRLTSDSGLSFEPTISTDGRFVAYVSDRGGDGTLDLWIQQISGGAPVRLIHSGRNTREPCFSPDGSKIAFRSERDGGGIYVVATLSGEEKLLVPRGRNPRFSPDGEWIAYWAGDPADAVERFDANGAAIFVIPANGGVPRRLGQEFATARYPLWSPDGGHILFIGSKAGPDRQVDWYVTPDGPGPVVKTGLLTAIRKWRLIPARMGEMFIPSQWIKLEPRDESKVLFSAITRLGEGHSTNIWAMRLSPRYLASGDPVEVTNGERIEAGASCAGSRMAFASLEDHVDIWALPRSSGESPTGGELIRVTDDIATEYHPTVSADGKIITFDVPRPGANGIWMHAFESRRERAVSITTSPDFELDTRNIPVVSHDGKEVAYQVAARGKVALYVSPVDRGPEELVSPDGFPFDWLWKSRKLLVRHAGPNHALSGLEILDIAADRSTELKQSEPYEVRRPAISPDDRWLAFYTRARLGRSRVYIAALNGDALPPQRELIPVTDGGDRCEQAVWAPSGDELYFVSGRDGSRCIWSQRLDPNTKRPVGEPTAVYHFHRARRDMTSMPASWLNLSASRDKLVFNLNEISGNIWLREEK